MFGVPAPGAAGARTLDGENAPGSAELVFAESASGDRFVLTTADDGSDRVVRLRAESEERWVSGSGLERWLDAQIAREQLLVDDEGEFAVDVFDEDGEELLPVFALRQAERGLRKDPGSAELHHDLGIAQRRMGKPEAATRSFGRAAELDPDNPWPLFDLGRTRLELGQPDAATVAFAEAARSPLAGESAARLWAWSALAAQAAHDAGAQDKAIRAALAVDPQIVLALERAAEAASAEGDLASAQEAAQLVAAFKPATSGPRLRLPVVAAPAATATSDAEPAPRRPRAAKAPDTRPGKPRR